LFSFAYVYFLESGLFNELQPVQIKKSFPASGPAQDVPSGGIASDIFPLSLRRRAAGIYPAKGKVIARISGQRNKLHGSYSAIC
jgi:hypothetical protein